MKKQGGLCAIATQKKKMFLKASLMFHHFQPNVWEEEGCVLARNAKKRRNVCLIFSLAEVKSKSAQPWAAVHSED